MASSSIKAESGLQMLSRLSGCKGSSVSDLQPALFLPGLLKPHEVVEIRCQESSVASRLCSHFLERCILPISAGGLALDAIFINTEHQVRIHHMVSSLEIALRKGGMGRKDIQKTLKSALSQLLVVQCFNSTQLLSSMHSLPQLIRSRQNKVGLVVIDSPASYYQSDLLYEGNANSAKVSKEHYLADILSPLLSSEINQLNIVLVFTLPTNYKKSFAASNLPSKSYTFYVKTAEIEGPSTSEAGNGDECFQVILHRGKDYVLRTSFSIVKDELLWENDREKKKW